jgi:hypothetical protein
MRILLLFIAILFNFNCEDKSKLDEKVYLPEIKFKRTKNPNYSQYFPDSEDTINHNSNRSKTDKNLNTTEPLPSFESQPISNSSEKKENSSGFFTSLFSSSQSKNKKSEEEICSELLNINKVILNEQNSKLITLENDKKKLLEEIISLEKKYQKLNTKDQKDNQRLETEIIRLNSLIKILSSELR